jgi:hypothetical protein
MSRLPSRLYHLTYGHHLESIAEHGLRPPEFGNNLHITLGIPCVWLSTNLNPGWVLHAHKDAFLLTVEPSKKRLAHWRSWLASAEAETSHGGHVRGLDLLVALDAEVSSEGQRFVEDSHNYYIYFGTIPPSRIKRASPVKWKVAAS